jgi:hypothetical protein
MPASVARRRRPHKIDGPEAVVADGGGRVPPIKSLAFPLFVARGANRAETV